jgi:hypothetical protein
MWPPDYISGCHSLDSDLKILPVTGVPASVGTLVLADLVKERVLEIRRFIFRIGPLPTSVKRASHKMGLQR